jgi:hypothetical protein
MKKKLTEEEIKNLQFNDLIIELSKYEDCCVNAKHVIVQNLKFWLNLQRNYIDNLRLAKKDPKKDTNAKTIKKTLVYILIAIQDSKNVYPAGTLPPRNFSSIYPLR